MQEFEIHYTPSNDYERVITAFDKNGVKCGGLNFSPIEGSPGTIQINALESKVERKGIATLLLKKMVEILGPGVLIDSAIIHDDTKIALEALGYFDKARAKGAIEIGDQGVLDSLPVVKLRTKAGIFTNKIKIGFDPRDEDNPFYISAIGITDPDGSYRTAQLKELGANKK